MVRLTVSSQALFALTLRKVNKFFTPRNQVFFSLQNDMSSKQRISTFSPAADEYFLRYRGTAFLRRKTSHHTQSSIFLSMP